MEFNPQITPAQQGWIEKLIADKVAHITPLISTTTSASIVPSSNADATVLEDRICSGA